MTDYSINMHIGIWSQQVSDLIKVISDNVDPQQITADPIKPFATFEI